MQNLYIRSRFATILILIAVFTMKPGIADQGPAGFLIEDAQSVEEAVANIRAALEQQGFSVDLTINHASNAASVGLQLRPTHLLLFSKPELDISLTQRGQTSAIDLPGKYLVWQDEPNAIRLAYNSAGYLLERHDLPVRDSLLSGLNKTLQQFSTVQTGLITLDNGLVTVDSAKSVESTVHDLQAELQARGFIVPLTIDYRARANAANTQLRPTTLIIFGNPAVGTQLMQNQQSVGLDLPQKYLVWEDAAQQVHITYNDPHYFARRHGIQGLETLLETIATVLSEIADLGGNS